MKKIIKILLFCFLMMQYQKGEAQEDTRASAEFLRTFVITKINSSAKNQKIAIIGAKTNGNLYNAFVGMQREGGVIFYPTWTAYKNAQKRFQIVYGPNALDTERSLWESYDTQYIVEYRSQMDLESGKKKYLESPKSMTLFYKVPYIGLRTNGQKLLDKKKQAADLQRFKTYNEANKKTPNRYYDANGAP
jgi:hypothetical protein